MSNPPPSHRIHRATPTLSLIAALAMLASTASLAAPGALEINAVCAEQTGCFPGDDPGYPVTINASGSYLLTGGLIIPDENTTAIDVLAEDVDLDLGGHTIRGPVVCTGVPVESCSGRASGVGIRGGSNVAVANGVIRGMGAQGIKLVDSARIRDVRVLHNDLAGIDVRNDAHLRDCRAISNGGGGMLAGQYSVVVDSVADGNAGNGLQLGHGSRAANNVLARSSGSPLVIVGEGLASDSVCDGENCRAEQPRRFYLTQTSHTGAFANSSAACAVGFHMASLWEIHEVSTLRYDTALGETRDDSGEGPPRSVSGWIRTGGDDSTSNMAGTANCDSWTTTGGFGSIVILKQGWETDNGTGISPFFPQTLTCSASRPVWCVQD